MSKYWIRPRWFVRVGNTGVLTQYPLFFSWVKRKNSSTVSWIVAVHPPHTQYAVGKGWGSQALLVRDGVPFAGAFAKARVLMEMTANRLHESSSFLGYNLDWLGMLKEEVTQQLGFTVGDAVSSGCGRPHVVFDNECGDVQDQSLLHCDKLIADQTVKGRMQEYNFEQVVQQFRRHHTRLPRCVGPQDYIVEVYQCEAPAFLDHPNKQLVLTRLAAHLSTRVFTTPMRRRKGRVTMEEYRPTLRSRSPENARFPEMLTCFGHDDAWEDDKSAAKHKSLLLAAWWLHAKRSVFSGDACFDLLVQQLTPAYPELGLATGVPAKQQILEDIYDAIKTL